jgi:hypothetical protein
MCSRGKPDRRAVLSKVKREVAAISMWACCPTEGLSFSVAGVAKGECGNDFSQGYISEFGE